MSDNKTTPTKSSEKTRLYAPTIKKILAEEGAERYPVMESIDKSTVLGLEKYARLCARHSAYNVLDVCINNYYGYHTSDAKAIWKIFIENLKLLPKYGALLINEIKSVYKTYTERYLSSFGYIGLSSPCDFWLRVRFLSSGIRNTLSVLAAYGIPACVTDSEVYSPDFTQYGVAALKYQKKTQPGEKPKNIDVIRARAEFALNIFIDECERINKMFLATRNTNKLTPGAVDSIENVGWAFVLLRQTCFKLNKEGKDFKSLVEEMEYSLEFKRRIMENVPSFPKRLCSYIGINGLSKDIYNMLSESNKKSYHLLFGNGNPPPCYPCPIENVSFNPGKTSCKLKKEISHWIKHEIRKIPKDRIDEPFFRGKLGFLNGLMNIYKELSSESNTFEFSKALLEGWTLINDWRIYNEKIVFDTDKVAVLYSKNIVFKILFDIIQHPLTLSDMIAISGLLDDKVELILFTALRHNILDEDTSIKELVGWTSPLPSINKQIDSDDSISMELTFPDRKVEELAELF